MAHLPMTVTRHPVPWIVALADISLALILAAFVLWPEGVYETAASPARTTPDTSLIQSTSAVVAGLTGLVGALTALISALLLLAKTMKKAKRELRWFWR